MTTIRAHAYQSLRRMGYTRGEAAHHLHITYALAWALDLTLTQTKGTQS